MVHQVHVAFLFEYIVKLIPPVSNKMEIISGISFHKIPKGFHYWYLITFIEYEGQFISFCWKKVVHKIF